MTRHLDSSVITQARQSDLRAVITALGGGRDRYDRAKYRLPDGRVLSLTETLFYDHTAAHGGAGAIDLVMHVRQCAFPEALAYLMALPSEASHAMPTRHPMTAPRAQGPFVPPPADERRWAQVRSYLTEERCLPVGIVDAVHGMGLVYADQRGNAVFPRQSPDGRVTGAALRNTWPGSDFKGLAPGTVRQAGYFTYQTGEHQPYTTPSLILTEAPIDALSIHTLRLFAGEHGRMTLLSTDGAGALPTAVVDQALAQGWTVQAAFDADNGGALLWQRLQEHYPHETARQTIWREVPPHGKDWNDTLRYILRKQVQALDRDVHGR